MGFEVDFAAALANTLEEQLANDEFSPTLLALSAAFSATDGCAGSNQFHRFD